MTTPPLAQRAPGAPGPGHGAGGGSAAADPEDHLPELTAIMDYFRRDGA